MPLTTCVLDAGTPLTMVLSESTTGGPTVYYLHGLGLVEQDAEAWVKRVSEETSAKGVLLNPGDTYEIE